MQVAIEACIDLAQHLIARRGWRTPRTYAEAFDVLAEHDVVPAEFIPTLHQMARLRNRLVHVYWEVDSDTLHDILQRNLSDLDRFSQLALDALSTD